MAHIEKRGPNRWRARYRTPSGVERSKTFERRIDAQRWLANVETAKTRGDWVDPAIGRRTFESWVREWQPTVVDLRPSTLDRDFGVVRGHLLPRFGPLPMSGITRAMIMSFIAELLASGRQSPSTVRKIGQVLSK
jgi:hypothetical protein